MPARSPAFPSTTPPAASTPSIAGSSNPSGLDRIQSNGYTFQIELKLRAWRAGFTLREVPIVFTERDSGESKMSGKIIREAVWRVWKLRLLDLLGKL